LDASTAIIEALYGAAAGPGLWGGLLGQLSAGVQAEVALCFVEDFRSPTPPLFATTHADDPVMQRYVSHHRDNPWSRAAARAPVGRTRRTEEAVAERELRASPFFAEVLGPRGLLHSLGAVLEVRDSTIAATSFLRGSRAGPFSDRELAWMQGFVPHLARAVDIRLRLDEADLRYQAALDCLARLDQGVLLFLSDGRVGFANQAAAAVLAPGDGLACRGGRLVAALPEENARLERLIGATTTRGHPSPGGETTVSRAAGRAPLRVLVAPLPIATVRVARDTPVAAAFLQDPEGALTEAAHALGQTHGLTPAEQRVAELIVSGCPLPEAARRLGVSLHTVRTHAARVRRKTGTRTQAALVAMVANGVVRPRVR